MTRAVRPERRPIQRLLPGTVEKIAAGEVVERPASVVKELVENAVDAGASTITVALTGGGLEGIEVSDDGEGIPASELELAVERHATSKLAPHGPVERVDFLGFRGEALASIAAVARLRLLSRPPKQEVGEGVSVVGGSLVGRFAAPRAPGTTVTVEDLFFNTPARRKFLRSPASEQLEAVRTAERLYLAHPSVGLRVRGPERELGVYPATTSLRDAAARVLGPEFLDASFPVGTTTPDLRLHGVLGLPRVSSSSATSLYLAVNGRAVASRALVQAVRAAFGDSLPRTRHPVGLLHLEVDPEALDVNVHPTKREVRFSREHEIADAVRRTVREALLAQPGPSPIRGGPVETLPSPSPPATLEEGTASLAGSLVAAVYAQRTLYAEPAAGGTLAVPAGRGRPRLELLGPFQALYWVAASEEGLLLIDQHAASERLLYETLRSGGTLARQALVDPVPLVLSGTEAASLEVHHDAVRAAGFEIEPFGPNAVRVLTVPAYRGRRAPAGAVRELLEELARGGRTTVPDGLEERTAASIACHAAIRAGDVVEREVIARLLQELDELAEPARTCPHGRPIVVEVPRSRLDRWFLRSGT